MKLQLLPIICCLLVIAAGCSKGNHHHHHHDADDSAECPHHRHSSESAKSSNLKEASRQQDLLGDHHHHEADDHHGDHHHHHHSHTGLGDASKCPHHQHPSADYFENYIAGLPKIVLAIAASIATSFIPVIVILIFPLHWRALRLFVAFAAGALIADVFTHQLPTLMANTEHHDCGAGHDHNHDLGESICDMVSNPLFRCAVSMMLSYMIDGIVFSRMARQAAKGGASSSHGHSHGHSHRHDSPFTPAESKQQSPKSPTDDAPTNKGDARAKKAKNDISKDSTCDDGSSEAQTTVQTTTISRSASAAIVDLFADTMHNFTDGMALGGSFLKGSGQGWHSTLLVLLHEVPHELGDGALLVRGGWTRWEAAKVQCWTGLGNLLGCLLVFLVNPDKDEIDSWVTPFVTGSFLYVALAGMLGELKETPPLSFINAIQLLVECLMFLSGWAFLSLVVHSL